MFSVALASYDRTIDAGGPFNFLEGRLPDIPQSEDEVVSSIGLHGGTWESWRARRVLNRKILIPYM